MATNRAFPWREAMTVGLGVLRLSPDEFWHMTPREFAAALCGLYGDPAPPLDRAAFDALRARFPDEEACPGRAAARSDAAQTRDPEKTGAGPRIGGATLRAAPRPGRKEFP